MIINFLIIIQGSKMRNMYDYAYEYEYQYHPERAGEMFAVVFASLWLAIMIGMLVFMLGSYLLHSFGLYTIAKRMGKKDADRKSVV